MGNSTPGKIVTPKNFNLKLCIRDNVGEATHQASGWQVTLCDLIWHVISRSGVVISITNCYIRFTLLYFTSKFWF